MILSYQVVSRDLFTKKDELLFSSDNLAVVIDFFSKLVVDNSILPDVLFELRKIKGQQQLPWVKEVDIEVGHFTKNFKESEGYIFK